MSSISSSVSERRRLSPGLAPAARARLIEAYSPGARVLRARRLRGGLGARTQVLDIEDAGGRRSKAVLRVYLPGRDWLSPERARCEFRAIDLANRAGVPAPQPLFLDADGIYLREPAMLYSYLPGRPLFQPRDVEAWAEQLAQTMLAIHAITPDGHDLTWLPRNGRDEVAAGLERQRDKVEAHEDALAREAFAVLRGSLDRIEWLPPCLVHDDFWPGNTVWLRGRLIGVIDWANACLGDSRLDLPQCCIDASLSNDLMAGELIRDAYVRLSGGPKPDQWFFDLYIGLRALLNYEVWLIGYHDAGLTFVTKDVAREKVHYVVRRALAGQGV